MRLRLLTIVTILSCGSDQPTLIPGFNPPPALPGEMTVISPVIKNLQPGADVTFCSYLDTTIQNTTDVVGFRAFQSVPGHHIMLVAVRHPQASNTHLCTDDDMVNIVTFVAGGGPDGIAHFKGIPDGLAFRMPAGTQLMLQSHWENASTAPRDGQAVIYLKAQPASPSVTPTDQFLADTVNFTIPAGGTAHAETTCKFQADMNFFLIGGHMHQWGKHVDIDLIDESGTSNRIYSQDWEPSYMTDPPELTFTKDQPFVVKAGQSIHVSCQWDNTQGTQNLRFPSEMCFFVGYYFPGHGLMDCEEGVWPAGN